MRFSLVVLLATLLATLAMPANAVSQRVCESRQQILNKTEQSKLPAQMVSEKHVNC